MRRLHRLGRLAVAVTCATAAVTAGAAAPAGAAVRDGLVTGFDIVTDDWGDEGPISRRSYAFSGVSGMWQRVLYADGAIERDGTRFDSTDMDCDFGPNTEHATRNWQARHGLAADGIVGRNTFSRADDRLSLDADHNLYYNGLVHSIYLGRRNPFPGLGWYSIDVPWGQGYSYLATYRPPKELGPLEPTNCGP